MIRADAERDGRGPGLPRGCGDEPRDDLGVFESCFVPAWMSRGMIRPGQATGEAATCLPRMGMICGAQLRGGAAERLPHADGDDPALGIVLTPRQSALLARG